MGYSTTIKNSSPLSSSSPTIKFGTDDGDCIPVQRVQKENANENSANRANQSTADNSIEVHYDLVNATCESIEVLDSYCRQQQQLATTPTLLVVEHQKGSLAPSQPQHVGNDEHVPNADPVSSSSDSSSDEDDEEVMGKISDLNGTSIKPCSSTSSSTTTTTNGKHVWFCKAEVREYAVIVGDHPYVKDGLPLSLDWKYNDQTTMIDLRLKGEQQPQYHYFRNTRRYYKKNKCRKLSYIERKNRLKRVSGYTEHAIRHETKKNIRKREREIALEYMMEVSDEYDAFSTFDNNIDSCNNYSYFNYTVDDCYDSDSEDDSEDDQEIAAQNTKQHHHPSTNKQSRGCNNSFGDEPSQELDHTFLFDVNDDDRYHYGEEEEEATALVSMHHIASFQNLNEEQFWDAVDANPNDNDEKEEENMVVFNHEDEDGYFSASKFVNISLLSN